MFKKLLRFLVFVVVAVLAVGYVSLNVAAGIIIVRDQNPDGVTVLTDEDDVHTYHRLGLRHQVVRQG